MTKKVFRPVMWFPQEFSAAEWLEIETAGAINLLPQHRERLQAARAQFEIVKQGNSKGVAPKSVRAMLGQLVKKLEDAETTLAALCLSDAGEAARNAVRVAMGGGGRLDDDSLADITDDLRAISKASRKALAGIACDGRGNPGRPGLDDLALTGGQVFADAGGDPRKVKVFLSSLQKVCGDDAPQSNNRRLDKAKRKAASGTDVKADLGDKRGK